MELTVALQHTHPGFALDVGFSAPPGVTVLFGRSGAGKTSIIQALAGLLRVDQGRVQVGETVLQDSALGLWRPPHRRRLGLVFQEARLFPHLSVRANLLYGQRRRARGQDPRTVDEVVALLGLGALLERRPAGLSGGEAQRVAIGRALLSAPEMLLLDEPLAALDTPRRAEILHYLERLRDERGLSMLYVTHQVSELARLARTVVVLEEGRVVRSGPVADVLADPAMAPLLGVREAGALLTARVVRHHRDGLSELVLLVRDQGWGQGATAAPSSPSDALTLAAAASTADRGSSARLWLPQVAAAPGDSLRLRISAQDVMLALDPPQRISALNVLAVTVVDLAPGQGPGMMVRLRVDNQILLARLTRRSVEALALRPGLACYAVIKSVSTAPGDIGLL